MKFHKIIIFFIIIVFSSLGFAKPRVTLNKDPFKFPDPKSGQTAIVQRIIVNSNNISAYFQNTGIFDQNTISGNLAGFEWPKGSGKTACFTAGLCLTCYITDRTGTPHLAEAMASYKGEFGPGAIKIVSGQPVWDNDPKFKYYKVKSGDNSAINPDYDAWTQMIPYGAPYVDVNNNGIFDPGIDVPGQKNAGQTAFLCMTDADGSNRSSGEGFGGGITNPLLYAEIHFTAWAYNTPGLEDLQFVNWVLINKGDSAWRRTFTGVVVDCDLGDPNDDYDGCDTTNKLNLGYTYNATNNDAIYGIAPPAFGMDYFKSPIIKNPDGSTDTLGLTSFTFFSNPSTSPPACETDPNGEAYPAYVCLKGFKKDGSPFLDPTQTPPVPTKFCYTGDPESGNGWTELKGSVQNCGGTQGTVVAKNPAGDRRFIFASGRDNFVVNPGDTQNIVLAQFVARGTSNLNSVTKLKSLAKTAKLIYLSNFNVTPPPPLPTVNASYTPLQNGLCNIVLSWNDVAESYKYWDTIFFQRSDSNIYSFEGYEVYEINKFANTLPDFTKPETMDLSQLQLVDAFDLKNGITGVIDTFSTGLIVNNQEQFSPYPIVPPYKLSPGPNWGDKGITRGITLTSTKFAQNYGNVSSFIYGQEYQFAVVPYAVSKSTRIRRGFKVIRASVSASVNRIIPIMPPAGTIMTLHNGDTINTSQRDLGCMPIIRNQDILKNASYRVLFNPLTDIFDTTYNILRKLDGASNFDTIKTKLKFIEYKNNLDDTSRTLDGILFKVQKIRWSLTGIFPDAFTNVGVIKDKTLTMGPDSVQARNPGWEFKPANHQFFKGSAFIYGTDRPWNSKSMSLSYPCANTYTNIKTKLPPDKLRKVKIVFSNTNTQMAYHYVDSIANNYQFYQDMVSVPFKVYESEYTDSTTTDVQLNCGFIESRDVNPPWNSWHPTSDSLGGKLLLLIFASPYDPNITAYKYDNGGQPINMFLEMKNLDVEYVMSPRLVSPGATFVDNDEFWIYPYAINAPYIQGNLPLYYDFHVTAPVFGDLNNAKTTNAMDRIRVVPNPYYGFSTLDRSLSDKFVTFRNLPLQCTIKIFTLNGDLIRTLVKSNTGGTATSSTLEWNLQNSEKTPIASGIYIALIDAPGLGQKIIKLAIFTEQERINF